MADKFLIVGLGNPGREYDKTRHNIGFRSVDAIADAHGMKFTRSQSKALIADGTIAGEKVMLAKPQTYMNLSGEAVHRLLTFYKIPLDHLLVISDDMDVPAGTLRIREKGGAGGQKGLRSIIDHVGTQDFSRLRVGIGRPPGRMDPAAYVLQDFDKGETILVIETLDRVVRAVETWLRLGISLTMTRFNGTADEAAHNASRSVSASPKPDTKPETTASSPVGSPAPIAPPDASS